MSERFESILGRLAIVCVVIILVLVIPTAISDWWNTHKAKEAQPKSDSAELIAQTVAQIYHVEPSIVHVDYKPHDCEFDAAPLGKKYCHYEQHVAATVEDFCLAAKDPTRTPNRPYISGDKLFDSSIASYYRGDNGQSREDWYCEHNVGVKIVSVQVGWDKVRD
jgi:hypothetical protein